MSSHSTRDPPRDSTAGPPPGPSPAAPGFQQRLGLFDATMLVAGTMIGSGIFIVSADISRDVGSSGWLLVIWALTGLMTLMGALSYAELAAMMPQAGGQYVFLREAYGPLWGFLYGWSMFLVIQTGTIAAVGVAFAKFLGVLVPALGPENVLWKVDGFDLKLALPLPWLAAPLVVFERTAFTIDAGQLVAVGLVVVLTWVNARGVQEGKTIQNVFTVAKVMALVVLIVLGLTVAASADVIATNRANLWAGATDTPRFEDTAKLVPVAPFLVVLMVAGGAMVGSLFSADAWNNVTFTAAEVRNPRRNLPLALALGVGLVVSLYLLANVAYLAALPVRGDPALDRQVRELSKVEQGAVAAGDTEGAESARKKRKELLDQASVRDHGIAHAKDDRVGTAVMEVASPQRGVALMAIAILVSSFGCVNGLVLMGARLHYAMARDGLFFPSVGTLNARGVPAVSLVLQAVWASVLVFSGTYGELLDYVIFVALVFYALTVAGVFVLRAKRPDAERPYRAFGYPVVPLLYIALCTGIMLDLLIVRPKYTWPGLLLVIAGVPVYFLCRHRFRRTTEGTG